MVRVNDFENFVTVLSDKSDAESDSQSEESESEQSESEDAESVKAAEPAEAEVPAEAAVEQVAEEIDEAVNLAKSLENLELETGEPTEENDEANEDEDEHHPAYIPRKGLFFLHDDRIDNEYPEGVTGPKMDLEEQEAEGEPEEPEDVEPDVVAEGEVEPEVAAENSVPPELDQEAERAYRAARKAEKMGEKWSHDKYDDELQNPRSQQELVDRYGFDIRTLNPDQIDFSRPLGQTGDESPSTSQAPAPRRGGPSGRRGGGGDRGSGRVSKNSNRGARQDRAPKSQRGGARGGAAAGVNGLKNMDDFPELTVSVGKKSGERQTQKAAPKSARAEPKPRKGRNGNYLYIVINY